MSAGPPTILRYVFSHAVPIMRTHAPERWWHACQDLPPEIKAEVLPWLRQEKHRRDCWGRHCAPHETGKARR